MAGHIGPPQRSVRPHPSPVRPGRIAVWEVTALSAVPGEGSRRPAPAGVLAPLDSAGLPALPTGLQPRSRRPVAASPLEEHDMVRDDRLPIIVGVDQAPPSAAALD